jgi:hypothetical protein
MARALSLLQSLQIQEEPANLVRSFFVKQRTWLSRLFMSFHLAIHILIIDARLKIYVIEYFLLGPKFLSKRFQFCEHLRIPNWENCERRWSCTILSQYNTDHTGSRAHTLPGVLTPDVKRSGREADHSPPSSVEVKNAWSYASTLQYVFMVWRLVKHKDLIFLAILKHSFAYLFEPTLTAPCSGDYGQFRCNHFSGY